MQIEAEEHLLRKAYSEIIAGLSVTRFRDTDVYIKHPSALDSLEVDFLYLRYYNEAVARGYPTQEERLQVLERDGLWNSDEDKQIELLQTAIQNSLSFKRKAFRKSDIETLTKEIKEYEENLTKKLTRKENLIASTAEKFSRRRTDAFNVSRSFYKDKQLTKLVFSEEDFDNFTTEEIDEVYTLYYSILNYFTDLNIKKVAIKDFFLNIFYMAENTYQLFGRPLVYLTFYQTQLAAYGSFFKNVLSGEIKPSPEIASDAEKLEDWYFGRTSAEEELKRLRKDGNEDTALVGLTSEDRSFLGMELPVTPSLKDKINEAGGEISIEEIMKMEGYNV